MKSNDNKLDSTNIVEIYYSSLKKPLLDEKKQRELMTKIKSGDKEAKEEFIEKNLRLVLPVAYKYLGRGLELPDLIQEGNIGLMIAVDRFDLSKQNKFSTYAMWWIRQAISRSIADCGNIIRKPVHFVDSLSKIKRVEEYLIQKNGTKPTKKQLAKALNMSPKKLDELLCMSREVISINTPMNPDKNEGSHDIHELGDFIETEEDCPEEEVENKDRRRVIKKVMDQCLNEREKDIIRLRFGFGGSEPLTLNEIGDKYSLTRERIRQIEAKALKKIRTSIHMKYLSDYQPNTYKKKK